MAAAREAVAAAVRRPLLAAGLLAALVSSGAASFVPDIPSVVVPLPSRLTDGEFWRLVEDFSEPNGYFRSENLVSNEHTFQYVIPALQRVVKPGGVYLGVAPDQNFTYIVATKPAMAFIVDIRRGNLLELLLYKALVEMSADRADFLARLFSRERPAGLGPRSTVAELFSGMNRQPSSETRYKQNVRAVDEWLVTRHRFGLSPEDLEQIESIYFAFYWNGPDVRYSTSPVGFRGRGFGGSNFPTYQELMLQTDWDGRSRGYLASEESFRYLKQFEEQNLLVPVVGNFAGPKTLRAVGRYIRDHGSTVSAFYVSNVEQYLFQDRLFPDFARNVATLPVDASSTFIRSVSTRWGYSGPYVWSDGRASALDPIRDFVRDFQAGRIRAYSDVNMRSR